jgi:hypothetical protein
VLQEKLLGNSADNHLEDALGRFERIKVAAQQAELQQERSIELLHKALAHLYGLGELLRTQPSEPGRCLIEEFVISKGRAWNKPTRKNPYIALVQLAFTSSSPSTRSQCAAVLAFASDIGKEPCNFVDWLVAGGGIKGRHPEALDHLGSPVRQRNQRERAARLQLAKTKLLQREHSDPVMLPSDADRAPGLRLVLANVDASGHASIIDVVEASEATLENVLLGYETNSAVNVDALVAEQPLGRLYRAIDLVVGCTPPKSGRHRRDVLLLNTYDRGTAVCRVWAICEEYTCAWAGMVLLDHQEGLPVGVPLLMSADDAEYFIAEFPRLNSWTISTDPVPSIHAQTAETSIQLTTLDTRKAWRVGLVPTSNEERLAAAPTHITSAIKSLTKFKAEHERLTKKATFSPVLTVHCDSGALEMGVPRLRGFRAPIAANTVARELGDRSIATGDLERVLTTLARHGSGFEGAFFAADGVADAGLCLQSWFGDDELLIVLPTRSGTAIHPSCTDLVLTGVA